MFECSGPQPTKPTGSNAKMFLSHLAIPSRVETPVVFFLVVTVRPSSELSRLSYLASSGGNISVQARAGAGGGPIPGKNTLCDPLIALIEKQAAEPDFLVDIKTSESGKVPAGFKKRIR